MIVEREIPAPALRQVAFAGKEDIMPTMTQVFQEARALPSRDRTRLVSKLIAADMPAFVTDDEELARREDDVRNDRVRCVEVASVMP